MMQEVSKGYCQRIHAKRRAFERYGLTVNKEMSKNIVRRIQSGEALFIGKKSRRVSNFSVIVGGVECIVGYDSSRKNICTFLPNN